jgi:hypothetical protein
VESTTGKQIAKDTESVVGKSLAFEKIRKGAGLEEHIIVTLPSFASEANNNDNNNHNNKQQHDDNDAIAYQPSLALIIIISIIVIMAVVVVVPLAHGSSCS